MQGSILYIDHKQGFIQGEDQTRYYFTDTDWLSSTAPTMGMAVTFRSDGQNARDVQPQVVSQSAGWGQTQPPPQSAADYGQAPYGEPAGYSSEVAQEGEPAKPVYNLPAAGATLVLLISLMTPYGRTFVDYRLTDTGLGGLYYLIAVALIGAVLWGAPRIWSLSLWGLCILATIASLMGRESLFSQISGARSQMGQLSDAAGGLLGSQFGQQMQATAPSLTDHLGGGFYLHIAALLALGYMLLLYRYEVRAGQVSLETVGNTLGAGANLAAQTGRTLVANAERITGKSVPTAGETGSFLQNFLTFDKMIAPVIITVLYYINLILVILFGIGVIFSGMFGSRYSAGGGLLFVFLGILVLILGPLWVRFFAEFMIVIFKIHTRLTSLDDKTKP